MLWISSGTYDGDSDQNNGMDLKWANGQTERKITCLAHTDSCKNSSISKII